MNVVKTFREALAKRRQQHADYDYVFGTPEGKRVLADICKMGFIDRCTFAPLNKDKTILNEGSRLLALAILKKTHKQPIEAVTEAIIGD